MQETEGSQCQSLLTDPLFLKLVEENTMLKRDILFLEDKVAVLVRLKAADTDVIEGLKATASVLASLIRAKEGQIAALLERESDQERGRQERKGQRACEPKYLQRHKQKQMLQDRRCKAVLSELRLIFQK